MEHAAPTKFNDYAVRVMLIALTRSANDSVAELAIELLTARNLQSAILSRSAEFGGFMSSVVEGDFIEAFTRADDLNRTALLNMVLVARFGAFDDDTGSALFPAASPSHDERMTP